MTETVPAVSMATANMGVLIPLSVHFDDLDPMGMLHNTRYQALVERAWVAFWRKHGLISEKGPEGDSFNVVKAFTITYNRPIVMFGEYAVHLWIERMGATSATAGYRVCSADGETTYAYGSRTAVRLDPTTLSPTPWSEKVRKTARLLQGPQDSR
ncbi:MULTISPECIES: thioesterase family protein [unclassified Streptomyces]|uniref:acyl-CoA thioesterase n=1 Tax=unclassified Streptomyces TaxID=2593676 RepID=UPI00225259E2|nr:acyl-CoA thioesterase [Streptomyces sp. NBC_01571]MCX4579036.1 acyl-CoA thioesterase [Streptomyces sp. NBC_01571]WSS90235.1 acyl-CoA thioesterase [Streptomyces sp. NBC_01176]